MAPADFPDQPEEKARYETHNNDVTDERYQQFVSPIVNEVLGSFDERHRGLDYGCGPGPVVHYLLTRAGYQIDLYDPFFHTEDSVFSNTYDYIICCEVIEHFHHPKFEFERLHSLLNPAGKLICMTDPVSDEMDFGNWYYKNDPTHVFFYHPATIAWIRKQFGFASSRIVNRLIVLQK